LFVLTILMSWPVLAGEKDELATTLKQLDQVQASLERARVLAIQEGQADRFYFDYLRANRDLNIVREGINRYLTPSRACLSYTNILTRPLVIELLPHRLIPIKNTT
ncbi:integrative conjugative element protein, RAQPRD family, partial [Photorhabdus laumondii]